MDSNRYLPLEVEKAFLLVRRQERHIRLALAAAGLSDAINGVEENRERSATRRRKAVGLQAVEKADDALPVMSQAVVTDDDGGLQGDLQRIDAPLKRSNLTAKSLQFFGLRSDHQPGPPTEGDE